MGDESDEDPVASVPGLLVAAASVADDAPDAFWVSEASLNTDVGGSVINPDESAPEETDDATSDFDDAGNVDWAAEASLDAGCALVVDVFAGGVSEKAFRRVLSHNG